MTSCMANNKPRAGISTFRCEQKSCTPSLLKDNAPGQVQSHASRHTNTQACISIPVRTTWRSLWNELDHANINIMAVCLLMHICNATATEKLQLDNIPMCCDQYTNLLFP
ncbi:hypothetical protein DPEC_G00166370 [Dallia pectoralis]|uniref:Uncharacterized protein n=1 Tax=Dallia pectoralis TaxID=75939 RepID=A0ACC2GHD4_DALPE|nr:hypothetical protein DPEC_G00166370 [Dallia pectoralis]